MIDAGVGSAMGREPLIPSLFMILTYASVVRASSHPGSDSGVENPKPGNEGMMTWNASAASPP